MPFDQWTERRDVEIVDILDEEHGVRIAHGHNGRTGQVGLVHRADLHVDAAHIHLLGQRNVFPAHQRRAHVDRHKPSQRLKAFQHVGFGLDRDHWLAGFLKDEMRHGARTVPASGHFAAIGIPDAHEYVFCRVAFERDDLVSLQIGCDLAHLLHRRREGRRAGIKHGKRIAGTIHPDAAHVRRAEFREQVFRVENARHFGEIFGAGLPERNRALAGRRPDQADQRRQDHRQRHGHNGKSVKGAVSAHARLYRHGASGRKR